MEGLFWGGEKEKQEKENVKLHIKWKLRKINAMK